MNKYLTVVVIGLAFVLQGCATGYNRSLVTNSSSVGMNFDTAPGKIETAISSTSGGMTPTFEGGQTLPILSRMATSPDNPSNFFAGNSSTVTTGDAAYTMSYLYADCNRDVAPLKEIPDVKLTQKPKQVPGPGEVRPAVFMSSSLLGANISFGNHNAIAPTGIKLGFARKDEVSTPVSVTPDRRNPDQLIAGTPSLMATLDRSRANKSEIIDGKAKPTYQMYFASGEAADNLALRSDVRKTILKRIAPEMIDHFCEIDYETRSR